MNRIVNCHGKRSVIAAHLNLSATGVCVCVCVQGDAVVNVHEHLCHRADTSPVYTSPHSTTGKPVHTYVCAQKEEEKGSPLAPNRFWNVQSAVPPVLYHIIVHTSVHYTCVYLWRFIFRMSGYLMSVDTKNHWARYVWLRMCLVWCATVRRDRADRCVFLLRHTFHFRSCTYLSLFAYKLTKMKVDQNWWLELRTLAHTLGVTIIAHFRIIEHVQTTVSTLVLAKVQESWIFRTW